MATQEFKNQHSAQTLSSERILRYKTMPRVITYFQQDHLVESTPIDPAAVTLAETLVANYGKKGTTFKLPLVEAPSGYSQRQATLWLAKGAIAAGISDEFNIVPIARATDSDYSEFSARDRIRSAYRPTFFEEPEVLDDNMMVRAQRLYQVVKDHGSFGVLIVPYNPQTRQTEPRTPLEHQMLALPTIAPLTQ